MGASWMQAACWVAIALSATATVVLLQYRARRTLPSRVIIGMAVVLAELSFFLPWRVVLAVEGHLSSDLRASAPVAVAFEPQAGPYRVLADGAAPLPRLANPNPLFFSGPPRARRPHCMAARPTAWMPLFIKDEPI